MTVDADTPALTGGLKTIYGMLVELRDGRIAERTADDEFMTNFRGNCESTVKEYTGKIEALKASISADTITSGTQAQKIEDETTKKGTASSEKIIVETALAGIVSAHAK